MSTYFESLVQKIVLYMISNGMISKNDTEVYRFGVEVTLLKVLHLLSYLFIAIVMQRLSEFFVIFSVFYIFRENTGGFHAKTRWGCYLFSCTVIVFFLLLAGFRTDNCTILYIWASVDIIVLLLIAPVKNKNRGLDDEDIRYFRTRLLWVSGIFLIIYMIAIVFEYDRVVWLLTVGISMNTFLTISGKLQYFFQIRRER